jgi:hypothetical protein
MLIMNQLVDLLAETYSLLELRSRYPTDHVRTERLQLDQQLSTVVVQLVVEITKSLGLQFQAGNQDPVLRLRALCSDAPYHIQKSTDAALLLGVCNQIVAQLCDVLEPEDYEWTVVLTTLVGRETGAQHR